MKETNRPLIQKFSDDERMFEAVKEELLDYMLSDLRNLDINKNNSELGESVRARISAKGLIDAGFKEFRKLRTIKEVGTKINPGR